MVTAEDKEASIPHSLKRGCTLDANSMDLESRLEIEARGNTAAIMSMIELCITDQAILACLRKHVGDVLHDSRRALIKEFGGSKNEEIK